MSIDVEIEGHIAVITINRPDRLNAMDAEHYHGLSQAWMRVRDDPELRVAVVKGGGDRAFTVGADIKGFLTRDMGFPDVWMTQRDQILNRGIELWKPVVAAVNGYCLGGGVTLLLATDIRIASETATFGLSEVKRGIIAGNGGTQRVLSQLPYPIAMEMLLTGDAIPASEAARWGLINKVVPPAALVDTAMDYARRLANLAPLALQAAKELAIRSRDVDLNTGLRIERLVSELLRRTDDAKEGARAFAEKRQPNFQGR
ncbi:MAG: enoyl-CoA hydratase-related protein [Acetobacteraceae bacterium]